MKKRILSLLLAGILAASMVLPSFASYDSWQEAYKAAIKSKADSWGSIIQLVDLDLDGTPELLIGSYPGSGLFSLMSYAATYKNGELTELTFDEGVCLSTGTNLTSDAESYIVYRNTTTGQTKIEGGYTFREGAGYYSKVTANYSLSGTKITETATFVESVAGSTTTYKQSGKTVSASQYKTATASRNGGWKKAASYNKQLAVSKKPTTKQIQELLDSYEVGPVLATASTHNIQVDGQPVSLTAYSIGGSNYFKLRDVAKLLSGSEAQFEVGYDNAAKLITLTTGQSYTAVGGELQKSDSVARMGTTNSASISLDGESQTFTAYNIDGNNYFMLRDLGKTLGFNVTWDNSTRTVSIITTEDYTG